MCKFFSSWFLLLLCHFLAAKRDQYGKEISKNYEEEVEKFEREKSLFKTIQTKKKKEEVKICHGKTFCYKKKKWRTELRDAKLIFSIRREEKFWKSVYHKKLNRKSLRFLQCFLISNARFSIPASVIFGLLRDVK